VRKISLILLSAILLALPVAAQTTSTSKTTPGSSSLDRGTGEAYLGWTHVTGDVGKNGWDITGAYNIGTHFALEAEGFGAYGDSTLLTVTAKQHEYGFLGGGKVDFNTHSEKFVPWVHLLLGVGHTGFDTNIPGANNSDTSFTWALGGGLDYNITPSVAARGKADIYHTSYFGEGDAHAKWGLGILYRFGK